MTSFTTTPSREVRKVGILGDAGSVAVDTYGRAALARKIQVVILPSSLDATKLMIGIAGVDLLVIADHRDDVEDVVQTAINLGVHVLCDRPYTWKRNTMDIYAKATRGGGNHGLLLVGGVPERLAVTVPVPPLRFGDQPCEVTGVRRLAATGHRPAYEELLLGEHAIDRLAQGLCYIRHAESATLAVAYTDGGDTATLSMVFSDGGRLSLVTHWGRGKPCDGLTIEGNGTRAQFFNLGAPTDRRGRLEQPRLERRVEDFDVPGLEPCRWALFGRALEAIASDDTLLPHADVMLLHAQAALRKALALGGGPGAVVDVTF